MARLNKKSTKAAIVKLLNKNDYFLGGHSGFARQRVESYLLELAKELELEIKPEEYKSK